MELQYTLEAYAAQLKNKPRTLLNVAGVVQKMRYVTPPTVASTAVYPLGISSPSISIVRTFVKFAPTARDTATSLRAKITSAK